MKRILFSLSFLLCFFIANSQNGWREGEMEVRVSLGADLDFQLLNSLKLNGDIYSDHALMYLTPGELRLLSRTGLNYQVLKEDLNEYYRDFWSGREEYHAYDDIIQAMNTMAFSYASICKKFSFGTSIGGRQLTALKISDNVNIDEPEPEVLFDGGIHGDELMGPEILIRFAEEICGNYGTDPDITDMIDNREIWLYMMVNPDGRVNMSRYNNNGVDLNRDWGFMWDAWGGSPGAYSQVESKALRSWMYGNQAVVHTTYHGGTEELLYPWSYRPDPAPDDIHLHDFATIYVSNSGYASLPFGQGYGGLYPINGSTKDANYAVIGSVTWTMEISLDKQPPTSLIPYYYNINYTSIIATIEAAGNGLSGLITDAVTGEPVAGIVFVDELMPVYSDPDAGDYHKYVVPGTYDITVVANGYEPLTHTNVAVGAGGQGTSDFALQPAYNHYAYRIVGCQIPDNNFEDEGNTPASLWAPDDVNYSIGVDGWVILDMQHTILDGPGNEITVHEGDNTTEGYACYAGPNMDGPWTFLGNGWGTTTFNFTTSGLEEARYVRLVDDGDGPNTAPDAGFDLDAVEVEQQPAVVYLIMDCHIDDQAGNNDGRIDPGESFNLIFSLRNHGGLTASNLTGNLNYDSTWITVETPDVIFGDIGYSQTGEAVIPMIADTNTPLETIVMMVMNVTANEGGFIQQFPLNFTVGAIIEDWETNTFTKFNWVQGGTAPWTITPINVFDGIYSAKSGNVDDYETSTLQVTMDVVGRDDISFYTRTSSENYGDYLNFYIDGILRGQWSGIIDWGKVSYNVEPGSRTFTWTFQKNGSLSNGWDCAWIDNIVFPSCNMDGSLHALANAFPHEYCGEGQSQLGVYAIGGNGDYSYSWSPAEYLNNTIVQFPVADPPYETTFSVVVTDESLAHDTAYILVGAHPIPETPVIEQAGDSIVSSASSGNQWYDSSGQIPGAAGQVFYPEDEDTYYVIVTSEFGCVSEPSNTVNFLFTDLVENTLGLGVRVYPNPAGEYLHVDMKGGRTSDVSVELHDLLGKKVYTGIYHNNGGVLNVSIDTGDLEQGIYLLSIKTSEGMVLRKIIR